MVLLILIISVPLSPDQMGSDKGGLTVVKQACELSGCVPNHSGWLKTRFSCYKD